MALNKANIKKDARAIYEAVMNDTEGDAEKIADVMAEKMADMVMNAIQSVTVIYQSGLVAPPGTAGGPVTGTFNGSLK